MTKILLLYSIGGRFCANWKRCIINEDFSHAKCKNPYNHIMGISFGLILAVTGLSSVIMAITANISLENALKK